MYKRQDQIYFLASAEDSNSTYEDGVVLGSWIGAINPSTFKIDFTEKITDKHKFCLLYTSDAADERSSVDLGGRRIIKKKKKQYKRRCTRRNTHNKR